MSPKKILFWLFFIPLIICIVLLYYYAYTTLKTHKAETRGTVTEEVR